LSVIAELAIHNSQDFVPLILGLHKILENASSNWLFLRIIVILKLLCTRDWAVQWVLETASSITVLFECDHRNPDHSDRFVDICCTKNANFPATSGRQCAVSWFVPIHQSDAHLATARGPTP
jgi:hypothetical protein